MSGDVNLHNDETEDANDGDDVGDDTHADGYVDGTDNEDDDGNVDEIKDWNRIWMYYGDKADMKRSRVVKAMTITDGRIITTDTT